MAEDYSEIFTSFTDIFDSFNNLINDVLLPQSGGIGGAFFVILAIVLLVAVAIVAFKLGRKRY